MRLNSGNAFNHSVLIRLLSKNVKIDIHKSIITSHFKRVWNFVSQPKGRVEGFKQQGAEKNNQN
jgi:hypothetical protein